MPAMKRRHVLALGLSSLLPFPLKAQSKYPDRAVRLVVPFAPGGDGDIIGRLWAKHASPHLGGNIVVENKPGAGGAIGAGEVARSSPDGYSLLLGTTTTQIVNPATLPTAPYDALKDFTLVGIVSINPTCVVVNPSLGIQSLKQLVERIKAEPGKFSYGSAGPGTITNLTGELLKRIGGGLQMTHVPYKGGAPAMQDLIAGHIPVITPILTSAVIAQHRAGRARILAVNSDERLKTAPDLPTAVESGMPELRVMVFNAVFTPAGVPQPVLEALKSANTKALAEQGLRDDLQKAGAELFTGPDAGKFIADEVTRWTSLIKAMGFRNQ
jgi:tripartite-type tricarboxylate transporter receptor subunit TctC